MVYMGSKRRIAKYILPIILKDRLPDQWYIEPFVGGGNIIDKVEGKRLGADSNLNIIQALEVVRDDVENIPKNNKEFNEESYNKFKENKNILTRHDISFCGFAYSYGGIWFIGWRRDKKGQRDYVAEAYRNAQKQSKNIQGVIFKHCNYDELEIPKNSIIYCDPPYANTTRYKDKFDHDSFWEWCRVKSREGHKVFISEYSAPDDFECIWSMQITSGLTGGTTSKKGTEKLFVWKG